MLSAEVASLETALHESEQCNASLTQLVQLLQDEMQRQEERRTRERLRVHRRLSGPLVPREALDSARSMLEEGSTALVAAHEHTLRLAEMRMAAMAEQLNRLSSALPHKEKVEEAPPMQLQPPSPTQSLIRTGFVSLLADDTDDTWAEPGLGGLCLDSLPLHVPSAGSHAAVTGGAYGIHGRRAAISTAPWSASPAALATGWWENRSLLEVAADGEPSTPPSPDGDATELVVAAGAMARTSFAPTLQAMERSADRGRRRAAAALEIAAAEAPLPSGRGRRARAAAQRAPSRAHGGLAARCRRSGGRESTSVRRRPGDLPRAAELFDLSSWAAADEQLRGASLSLAGWGDAALDSRARHGGSAGPDGSGRRRRRGCRRRRRGGGDYYRRPEWCVVAAPGIVGAVASVARRTALERIPPLHCGPAGARRRDARGDRTPPDTLDALARPAAGHDGLVHARAACPRGHDCRRTGRRV